MRPIRNISSPSAATIVKLVSQPDELPSLCSEDSASTPVAGSSPEGTILSPFRAEGRSVEALWMKRSTSRIPHNPSGWGK